MTLLHSIAIALGDMVVKWPVSTFPFRAILPLACTLVQATATWLSNSRQSARER